MSLPPPLAAWFAAQGWTPHPHQLALLEAGGDTLLIAPTGGGKTLAGFLPTLAELLDGPHQGMHTLYVSPLKALTHDIARNLARPVADLGLEIRIEDRTGDTSSSRRARQRVDPPQILLTTPESLALMLSYPEAPRIFAGLRRVVIDEIHALAESKRGDQLMLGLARLRRFAPDLRVAGLSATVENPAELAAFMGGAQIVQADPGPPPDIAMLETRRPPPWAGGGGAYAARDVMAAIADARLTLVFLNTRAQAELFFQALWSVNDANLPIGLHHGSLSREARTRVEAAMAEGSLRAVVATGSLDLGLDWGDVDLVIQVGAPKNVKRLVQRIGRANHRYNAPSRARIVPANRFEVIECAAALQAVAEGDLDGDGRGPMGSSGGLDVLCQQILITACAGPFDADDLFAEMRRAGPYTALSRAAFDDCLDFVATGGYALRGYDRWQRLMQRDGLWQLRDPRSARLIRMNIGTITAPELLKVRRRGRGGAPLGEVEESFAASLTPGDTFLIGGQTVRYDRLREMVVEVTPQPARQPKIAVFSGLKMATSTELSARVLALIGDPAAWSALPAHTRDWLALQREVARLPESGTLTCETFMRGGQAHLCIYSFAGRNANQTLGLLVTRRMEAAGLGPLGFVGTDYALLIWSVDRVHDAAALLSPEGLREGLAEWLADNAIMKRSFRGIATVAGLLQRNLPGQRKTGKQATFSSDIIYDTLRRYDPDHLLLRITAEEARRGLVDFDRIEEMLTTRGAVVLTHAERVTPLAAPLLLEAGRVPIAGEGRLRLSMDEAARLMREAGMDEGEAVGDG
ncbi:MAG: ligase-associated DNA damage response DEXH box helicase [Paracoccus sp. (in: a-proteobacteria)]|nr:ligase-associated DNA damage response DEXH box helicase [Paracoccus sp. (in: a-proteobacteria)]